MPAEKPRIFDDARRGTYCAPLEEVPVHGAADVLSVLRRGVGLQVGELMNKNSSRSHCIFTVLVHTKETTPDGEDLLKVGKLNLVDLAGAECIGKSGAKNKRAREAETSTSRCSRRRRIRRSWSTRATCRTATTS